MDNIDKLPPQSIEMEVNVLGSMLISEEAANIAVEMLSPSDFYKGSHRRIFEVARELYDGKQTIDYPILKQALTDKGMLEEIGGAAYLSDLAASVATSANIEHYAKAVKDKSLARQLIAIGSDIVRDCHQPGIAPEYMLEEAESRIMALGQGSCGEAYRLGDVLRPVMSTLLSNRGKGAITGIASGLRDLDSITGGFHPGEFNIIAGRPSTGKTSLALTIMHNMSCVNAIPIGFFSLEMTKEQVAQNMACLASRVDSNKLRHDRMSDEDWIKLETQGAGVINEAPLFIDDSPESRIIQIRARARRMKQRHDVEMVVVDYLQLINGRVDGSKQSRQEEVSSISRGLKALARELHIPVVALCQLNRNMEERTGHRPQLSDLRESGSLEQDSDQVILIHRPGIYENPPDRTKPVNLIVAKNRNGPVADLQATFLESYFRYESYTPIGLSTGGTYGGEEG